MSRKVDNTEALRNEAAAMLRRAERAEANEEREQFLVWAQDFTEAADRLEMSEARYAPKH